MATMNGRPIRHSRSLAYVLLPLRLRLPAASRPERKNIKDIRLRSCQMQNKSKPSQRCESKIGKACQL